MLVLVRREVAAGVPEAAAQSDVHRVLLRGPVERLRHRGAPVDDHRVALGVVHMPAPDVETLALRALRLVGAGRVQIVEAAEEQRGVAEVGEGLDPLVDLVLEDRGVHPVRGDVRDVEVLHVLAHRAQCRAGRAEVGTLAGEGVLGGWGGQRGASGRPAACEWVRRSSRWMPSGFRPGSGTPSREAGKSGDSRSGEEVRANPFSRTARGTVRGVIRGIRDATPISLGVAVRREAYTQRPGGVRGVAEVRSIGRRHKGARIPSWIHERSNLHPRPFPARSRRSWRDRLLRRPPPPPCRRRPACRQGLRGRGVRRGAPRGVRGGGGRTTPVSRPPG